MSNWPMHRSGETIGAIAAALAEAEIELGHSQLTVSPESAKGFSPFTHLGLVNRDAQNG